jgi:glycosyltransferase involved in cell wall biosynthesis
MKEIIHCISTISLGGAEKQLFILVNEQLNLGHQVSVIYLKDEPELKKNFQDAGATVIDSLWGKNICQQIHLLRKFLKGKNAVLHAHLPQAELICALSKQKCALVISKHNSEKFFPRANDFISLVLARYVFYRSDICISISNAVQSFLIKIREIKDCSKLEVIYYGYSEIDSPTIAEVNSWREKLELKNEFVIGTIARMVSQKNYAVLLSAFRLFQKNHENSKLLLIGDGTLREEIFALSRELKIYDNIIWVRHTNAVPALLSLMNVFVLTSNYEGFGLVLLESMSRDIPVLASNNSSIPEVLGQNYPGLFHTGNFEDLAKLMEDCLHLEFYNKIKLESRNRLLNFNSKKMALQILEAYKRINA